MILNAHYKSLASNQTNLLFFEQNKNLVSEINFNLSKEVLLEAMGPTPESDKRRAEEHERLVMNEFARIRNGATEPKDHIPELNKVGKYSKLPNHIATVISFYDGLLVEPYANEVFEEALERYSQHVKAIQRSITYAEEKAIIEDAPAFLPGGKYHDDSKSDFDSGYRPGHSGPSRSGDLGDGLRGDDSNNGGDNGRGQSSGEGFSGGKRGGGNPR